MNAQIDILQAAYPESIYPESEDILQRLRNESEGEKVFAQHEQGRAQLALMLLAVKQEEEDRSWSNQGHLPNHMPWEISRSSLQQDTISSNSLLAVEGPNDCQRAFWMDIRKEADGVLSFPDCDHKSSEWQDC